MVINGDALLRANPVTPMRPKKDASGGISYGLSEAGYDIQIKEDILFTKTWWGGRRIDLFEYDDQGLEYYYKHAKGRFILASSIQRFAMPSNLMGVVHDKSTWARLGLSVFNTVLEPGWEGYLTLELVYHGSGKLHIPAGSGIAQVVFHETKCEAHYNGKYQYQPSYPVEAKRDEPSSNPIPVFEAWQVG